MTVFWGKIVNEVNELTPGQVRSRPKHGWSHYISMLSWKYTPHFSAVNLFYRFTKHLDMGFIDEDTEKIILHQSCAVKYLNFLQNI